MWHRARAVLANAFRSFPVWWVVTGAVLFIRFPVKFALEPPFLMDFNVFRAVAERLAHGQAALLYAPTAGPEMVFKYGPVWAVLFAPLAWIGAHPAAVAWAAFTVACLLAAGFAAHRLCRDAGLPSPPWAAPLAVVLLSRPITSEFLQGQTNLLWAALACAHALFALRNRTWAAAAWLALAISLKAPALVFVPYYALQGRWQLLARTALCLAGANLLAAAALRPADPLQLCSDWFAVLATSGPDRAFEIGSQSLLSLLGRLLRDDGYGLNLLALPDAAVMRVAVALQLALFALIFLRRSRARAGVAAVVDAALLTTMMAVFSPTSWVATYSALLVPLAVLPSLALDRPAHAIARVTLAATAALSLFTHSSFWKLLGLRHFKSESYVYQVFLVLPILALTLMAGLWMVRRAAPPRTSRS